MVERNYEFRKDISEVHRPGRRMDYAVRHFEDIEVDSTWSIILNDIDDKVLYNAARDLEDYFAVSMGVFVGFNQPAKNTITYIVDSSIGENTYRITVTDNSVRLCGCDSRSAAKAGYHIEDIMNLAEAPYLKKGENTYNYMYTTRMVHSGFALDEFPDAYLNQLAHGGYNAAIVFVNGVNRSPHGYQDFNDLIYRASCYGIDVYAYSRMLSWAYPEGEDGENYYDSLYGELFRNCPGFKGVVFVGESVEFPSHDPHTTGRLRTDYFEPDFVVGNRVSPGWWPCEDFPLWVNMVKKTIRREKSDADIVFWTYNWGYVEEKYRLALIESLPTDISLLVTFEMFEDVKRDGVNGRTVDYSIFFEGPGKYFTSEAKAAKEKGIPLYAMTNTGGLCWDVGVIPYMPAPYQWLKRFNAMKAAHDDWGLCGLMESHHFGWYPSFISDFARFMFEMPDSDPEEILSLIAARDFSPDAVEMVKKAYRLFSDGVNNLISTNPDQYGPMRVGPAYPLLLNKNEFVFASDDHVLHGQNKITLPMYEFKIDTDEEKETYMGILRLYKKSAECFENGAKILDSIMDSVHHSKLKNAQKIANLAHFIAVSIRTAVNVKEWYLLKLKFNDENTVNKSEIAQQMLKIAEKEIANSESAIPMVRFDSRLGYEPSMDYMADEKHIRLKIDDVKRVISEELSPHLNC